MNQHKNKGFIKTIILIVIALILLKYTFGINLKDIIDSDIVQGVIAVVILLGKLLWKAVLFSIDFLKVAIIYIKDFFQGILN
jgi:hypothetical protein